MLFLTTVTLTFIYVSNGWWVRDRDNSFSLTQRKINQRLRDKDVKTLERVAVMWAPLIARMNAGTAMFIVLMACPSLNVTMSKGKLTMS